MYRLIFCTLFVFSSLAASLEGQAMQKNPLRGDHGALLQTEIHLAPEQSARVYTETIFPGSEVLFTAFITNKGTVPNEPGKIRIRYAYPKPLDNMDDSVLFETESVNIGPIPPGATLALNFRKQHQLPSLFDFVRNNWGLRSYEAVITIKNKETVAGTRPLVFSAFYHEGESQNKPARVISADFRR